MNFNRKFVIVVLMIIGSLGMAILMNHETILDWTIQVSTRKTNPNQLSRKKISKLREQSEFPILYPSIIPISDTVQIYPSISNSNPTQYQINLTLTESCQILSCRIGSVQGIKDAQFNAAQQWGNPIHPKFRPSHQSPNPEQPITLANGIQAKFIPYVCGASCTTSKIYWQQDDTHYLVEIQGGILDSEQELPQLLAMANSAITSP